MASNHQVAEKESPYISLNDLIAALNSLDAEDKEFFLENLLAALSPEYLKSIEQSRQDYREGRIVLYKDVFQ